MSYSEKLPLFSHSGASSSFTNYYPPSYLSENYTTSTAINDLFSMIKKVSGSDERLRFADNSAIPPQFQHELTLMFGAGYLTRSSLLTGMDRLCNHFLLRDREIQKRANAFVRIQLATAEQILYGESRCIGSRQLEKDQTLLFGNTGPSDVPATSFTPPGSPVRSGSRQLSMASPSAVTPSLRNDTGSSQSESMEVDEEHQDNISSPALPSALFRSNSVRIDHMKSGPQNVFEFDEITENALSQFLTAEFNDKVSLNASDYSDSEAQRLHEIWEYFDFGNDEEIVSKADIRRGLQIWGSNFISDDDICQTLANYYCQKKLKFAIAQLTKFYSSAPESIEVGSKVICTDNAGTTHCATVRALWKLNHCVEIVFTMSGKHMVVDARTIRLDPDPHAVSETDTSVVRADSGGNEDVISTRPRSNSAFGSTGLGDSFGLPSPAMDTRHVVERAGKLLGRHSFEEMKSAYEVNPPLPPSSKDSGTHSVFYDDMSDLDHVSASLALRAPAVTPVAGYPGIHDTLSEPGLSNGRIASSSSSHIADSSVIRAAYSQFQSDVRSDDGQATDTSSNGAWDNNESTAMDDDYYPSNYSYSDAVRDSETLFRRRVADPVHSSIDHSDGNNENFRNYAKHTSSQLRSTVHTSSSVGVGTDNLDATSINIDDATKGNDDAAPAVVPSGPPVAVTVHEQEILRALIAAMGPKLQLTPTWKVDPPFHQTYNLWFRVSGKHYEYHFAQYDYGVTFRDFLSPHFIGDAGCHNNGRPYSCTLESNRCFFLHLGVGIGIHPFALQALFRAAAVDVLSKPDELACQLFGECLREEPEYFDNPPGILNRTGEFVDALSLMAIWPVEMDDVRVIVCQLKEDMGLLMYTSFVPEHGPHDASGQWAGRDVVLTNHLGHFTLLVPRDEDANATLLLAQASRAVQENPDMADVMEYRVSVGETRYSIADVIKLCCSDDTTVSGVDIPTVSGVDIPTGIELPDANDKVNNQSPKESTDSTLSVDDVAPIDDK